MDNTIEVIISDLKEIVPENVTITELIVRFKERDINLIVEHNGRFVYPRAYIKTHLANGDRLEFINPNFGG